jgi:hypothetical protein
MLYKINNSNAKFQEFVSGGLMGSAVVLYKLGLMHFKRLDGGCAHVCTACTGGSKNHVYGYCMIKKEQLRIRSSGLMRLYKR